MKIKCKHIMSFSATVLMFAYVAMAHAQSAQQIAKKTFGSTVLLVMEDANGQPLSLGSGFFVGRGQIASNLHVVEGAARGYAKLVGQKTKYDIKGISAIDAKRDLVILNISDATAPAISLGASDAVEVGETIFAVGNPRGLEGTFSEGIVSSIRDVGTDKLIQITAPISPGSSGGPVLNSKGEVVGVAVATFHGGQNLNFAIPVNYLEDLIAKISVAKPLSNEHTRESEASIFSNLGGQKADGVSSGNLTWDVPCTRDKCFCSSGECAYSFSLRNHLRENVQNVYCLVVFYDLQDSPVEVGLVEFAGPILAGLAKRVKSHVHESVPGLSSQWVSGKRKVNVEFRILDFEIVE